MRGSRVDGWLIAAQVAVTIVLIIGGLWLWKRNYDECRAAGFSAVYCGTRR